MFFDSNQRLYNSRSEFVDALDLVPIPLNRNLRNTQRIHQASMIHYSGPGTTALGPPGTELNWVEVGTVSGMAKAAFDEVKRLVYREEVNPAEVAVLVPDNEARNAFMIASTLRASFCRCREPFQGSRGRGHGKAIQWARAGCNRIVHRWSGNRVDGIGLHWSNKGACGAVHRVPTKGPPLDRKWMAVVIWRMCL